MHKADEQTPAPARGTTPRTEAAIAADISMGVADYYACNGGVTHSNLARKSRQLERELSSANEQIAALREALTGIRDSTYRTALQLRAMADQALAATRKEEA